MHRRGSPPLIVVNRQYHSERSRPVHPMSVRRYGSMPYIIPAGPKHQRNNLSVRTALERQNNFYLTTHNLYAQPRNQMIFNSRPARLHPSLQYNRNPSYTASSPMLYQDRKPSVGGTFHFRPNRYNVDARRTKSYPLRVYRNYFDSNGTSFMLFIFTESRWNIVQLKNIVVISNVEGSGDNETEKCV